jgi:hypothetical protein
VFIHPLHVLSMLIIRRVSPKALAYDLDVRYPLYWGSLCGIRHRTLNTSLTQYPLFPLLPMLVSLGSLVLATQPSSSPFLH